MTQATVKETHIDYNRLVGRIDDEYFYLRYVFNDGKGFRGATGTALSPVTMHDAEIRREDFDQDNELWKQAVANNETTLSADDWHDTYDGDVDECVFDLSHRELAEDLINILAEEYKQENKRFDIELAECIESGRCFTENMKWDKLYNRNLWAIIGQYESKE